MKGLLQFAVKSIAIKHVKESEKSNMWKKYGRTGKE